MDFLIILLALGAIVVKAQKKKQQQKQQEEAARRRAWQAMQAEQQAAAQQFETAPQRAQPRMQPRVSAKEQPRPQAMKSRMNTAPAEGSIFYDSPEGEDAAGNAYATVAQSVHETAQHIVQPVTESSHAHVESSITGVQPQEACAPVAAPAPAAPSDTAAAATMPLRLNTNAARQAVLYAEILGKPKALRGRARA